METPGTRVHLVLAADRNVRAPAFNLKPQRMKSINMQPKELQPSSAVRRVQLDVPFFVETETEIVVKLTELRPPSPVRRVQLDVPFFVETDTEIRIVDATGPSNPKANPAGQRATETNAPPKLRSDVKRRVRSSLAASVCTFLLSLCAALAPLQHVRAATLTWTGWSLLTANWSDSANWDTNTIPNNGDTLVFPSNLAQDPAVNDLGGLTLNQLQFVGSGPTIILEGNDLTLTNGIVVNYGGGISISNNIVLAGTNNVMDVETPGGQWGWLYLDGTLSGSSGVTKTGGGVLVYQALGNNTYTGTTRVNDGYLQLNVDGAHAFEGPLVVGDGTGTTTPTVQLLQSTEISSAAVTVNLNGTLDFNNFNDTFNSLTLQGGTVQSGTGTINMLSGLTVLGSSAASLVSGNMHFNGGLQIVNVGQGSSFPDLLLAANVGDTGGGLLFTNNAPSQAFVRIYGTNTFTGPLTLDNLNVSAESPAALGATNAADTVGSHGRLWIYNTGITNHSLTLAGGAWFAGESVSTWAGPITLNGNETIDSYGAGTLFELDGIISGGGGFTKIDAGTLRLSGSNPNTYGGTTTVSSGTLELNKGSGSGSVAAVPGSLVLADGTTARLLQAFQLYSPTRATNLTLTLFPQSLFDLAGYDEWIGPLVTEGGQITTGGSGLLYLTGDITVITNGVAQSVISGNLELYGYGGVTTTTISNSGHYFSPDLVIGANLSSAYIATLFETGSGEVELAGTGNTFTNAVTINGGNLWVEYSNSLGNTNTPATVNPGGSLLLENNAAIGLKPLVLNGSGSSFGALAAFGTNAWGGDITLAGDTTITVFLSSDNLTLSGAISGPGGLTTTGQGTLLLTGSSSNTFAGQTLVQQGTLVLTKTNAVAIPGPVTIGAGLDGPNGDILKTLQPNQLAQTSPVNISSSGLFDVTLGSITRAGSIAGSGSVQMGTSMLMFGYDNTSTIFSGPFSGSADLTKVGTGTWTYTGTGSYSGNFGINSGQVFADGSLASAAIFFYAGTTLGGHGSVGPITSGNGLLTPGDNNPGILNSGSLSLASGNTLLAYIAGLNAGSGYSQLSFSGGTIALGNAHLQLNMSTLGATSNQFTLIHNPTLHVVSGTFAGLPEGGTVTANNGVHFTITYHGGAGNDVVLTQTSLPTPPDLSGIARLTNGNVNITGTGAPNVTYHVRANTNLATTNWVTIGAVTADNLGALIFTDSQAGTYPARFYRFVYP
jgi:autotransporter-associated beta strand protein